MRNQEYVADVCWFQTLGEDVAWGSRVVVEKTIGHCLINGEVITQWSVTLEERYTHNWTPSGERECWKHALCMPPKLKDKPTQKF